MRRIGMDDFGVKALSLNTLGGTESSVYVAKCIDVKVRDDKYGNPYLFFVLLSTEGRSIKGFYFGEYEKVTTVDTDRVLGKLIEIDCSVRPGMWTLLINSVRLYEGGTLTMDDFVPKSSTISKSADYLDGYGISVLDLYAFHLPSLNTSQRGAVIDWMALAHKMLLVQTSVLPNVDWDCIQSSFTAVFLTYIRYLEAVDSDNVVRAKDVMHTLRVNPDLKYSGAVYDLVGGNGSLLIEEYMMVSCIKESFKIINIQNTLLTSPAGKGLSCLGANVYREEEVNAD